MVGRARGSLASDWDSDATQDDPVTPEAFRGFMTNWPTGVSVVTASLDGVPAGCTVSAVMSLSLAPPLLIVSLAAGSGTLGVIRRAGGFAVNILSWDQRELCDRFARGPQHERFQSVELSLHAGVPVLTNAAASAVCRVAQTVPCADHVLVVGAPIWNSRAGARRPLVLHDRSHRRLIG
jgi:flavin reductase (DIM6/NTAB) family NADH-FMN oxidoreductase RutF